LKLFHFSRRLAWDLPLTEARSGASIGFVSTDQPVPPATQIQFPTGQLPHVLVFGLGCIGALALEIVRLYDLRETPPPAIRSFSYWIISVLYSALGGVVAVALPATTWWGAFYAGITMPVVISAAAKHRNRKTKVVALANEQDRMPPEPPHPQELQAARASWFKTIVGLFRDHADGLFGE